MLPENPDRPELALCLAPRETAPSAGSASVCVISFNTARETLRCIESLRGSTAPAVSVAVLDNGSSEEDFETLRAGCAALDGSELRLYRSRTNLGFAGGSNFLIEAVLAEPRCRYVALINNDAVAKPALLERLTEAMERGSPGAGLAGARMHTLKDPSKADALGIALYASLMPANRLDAAEPCIGPTGGCCLVSRALLDDLREASGYWFDPRYFCYCEDTDLALRAILLGYRPAYVDELLALHEGQASSTRAGRDFVAYHGLRNLIWMHAKLVPGAMLAKYGPLLAFAHVLTIGRYLLAGQPGVLFRVYRDGLGRLREFLRERRRFAAKVRVPWREVDRLIVPRFYRRGYFWLVVDQIFARYRDRSR